MGRNSVALRPCPTVFGAQSIDPFIKNRTDDLNCFLYTRDALKPEKQIPQAIFLPLAAAVLYVCYFAGQNNLGLVGPDEPRYVWVARAMAESGDWVTPRLYGETWFEKPILYYWGAAGAFRLFGVSEFAARLPSALMALLMTLAMAGLARRLYGTLAAQFLVLLLPTSVGMFAFARAATPDMLFSGSLTLALACATILAGFPAGTRPERYWLFLLGGAIGLAALAKGPAAIVLAGGGVFLWMLATRKWREAFRMLRPEAILAFAAVALPWYLLCAARNPDFVQVFLVSHNVDRFLTPVFRHEQPFWFYGPILLLGLIPWTAVIIGALADGAQALRARKLKDSAGFFLACWVIFPLLFFSISKSKLPGYILLVIPPLCLLMARTLSRAVEEERRSVPWLFAGIGVPFLGLAGGAAYRLYRLPDWLTTHPAVLPLILTVAGIGGLIILLGARQQGRSATVTASALLAALVGLIVFAVLPWLDPGLTSRSAALDVARREQQGGVIRAYRLHRAMHYGLNFYLARQVEEWQPASREPAIVCTSPAGFAELQSQGIPFRAEITFPPRAIICADVEGR